MRMSPADQKLLEVAKKLPADVLKAAVKLQADQCIFSEAYCLELATAYGEAAETARIRRTFPDSVKTMLPRSTNLSISPQE